MTGARATRSRRQTVAIIGGGFAGAGLAFQLARRAPGAFRIVVFEPRERLGCGVAYSTLDPAHRINVPASRMSFVPSDPCHFDRWLKADGELKRDPAALMPDGRAFPRRAVFGRYAAESIDPYVLEGAIEHRCSRVASATRVSSGSFVLASEDGEMLEADVVAFGATHPCPAAPEALEPLYGDDRMIVDTQDKGSLDRLDPEARVLIVGTGLTMADIVASLAARGHLGPITAISRRGLLSRGHTVQAGDEYGSFARAPSRTALELVRRIRRTVAAAEAEGRPWQHVLDAVRSQGPSIWAALSERERRIVARRLRPFWDVHRFRVAPQVEAAVAELRERGQLKVLRGEPKRATAGETLRIELSMKGGGRIEEEFDAVLLATGPAHRKLLQTSPLVSNLAATGLLTADRIGLGLAVDETSAAIGRDGRPTANFFVVGPLARATFGELMGLPEVARHAELVAGSIIRGARDAEALDDERALAVA